MEDNVIQINGGIMTNVEVDCKKDLICEKDYIWKPDTCSYENGKYLAGIMDDSTNTSDEII